MTRLPSAKLLLPIMVLSLAATCFAQTATLTGRVTDSTESVIPGTKITITNEATAAAREGVSVRREIGSASPQYHSAPWSTDRVDEVARDLKRKVPYIDPMQPQPLPDSYRSQPRPGLLTRLGQMRWVIGSAPARPTPTHARQPASSQPTDRVDRGPAAPALPTPSPTESRPPPAPPQRPQTAMDLLRGLAVPKDTTRKRGGGPSL